ncbi:MAG: hypothetical protein Q7K35_05750 [bacterium]|nr:hypothetical protein [bacterium]
MTIKIKKILIVLSLLIAIFALADFALAENFWGDNTNGESFRQNAGLAGGSGDLRVIIANVIRAVLGFLGILAVCIIIYAGFIWMTAGGEADRVERAKKILINGVIGLILVVASFAIVTFVLNSIIGVIGPGGGGEPPPPCVGPGCIPSAPPAPFSINGTIPWNTAIGIIRNVEIKAFFNKDLFKNTTQGTLNNNFKVQRIEKDLNGTVTSIPPNTEDPIVGTIASTTRMISFKPSAGCFDKEKKPVANCLPEWSKFQVTINGGANGLNGFGGLFSKITINGQSEPLNCNAGTGCTFVFSTNDSTDTIGPAAWVMPRQMCRVTAQDLLDYPDYPVDANLVSGRVSDDIGLANLNFYQKRADDDEVGLPPISFSELTPYWVGTHKYDTSAIPVLDAQNKVIYTFGIHSYDLSGHAVTGSFSTPISPGHCCNGKKDGNEIDIDCGGDCGACDGAACAKDMNAPITECSNTICASQVCRPQASTASKKCEAAGYAERTADCCLCQRPPVITGVFPVGGFCRDSSKVITADSNINTACLEDKHCTSPAKCNLNAPNGAAGNFVTVVGRYFGDTQGSGKVFFSNNREASLASSPGCVNSWTDTQIIVEVPATAINGPIRIDTSAGFSDDTTANPVIPNFVVNDISRPGLCSVAPAQGVIDTPITYSGIKLRDNKPYFGNTQAPILVNDSPFTVETTGTGKVPNIQTGRTTTFVMNGNVYSNYLDFTKLAEPYAGPIISSFDPKGGSAGQYVTINGRGFGAVRGANQSPNQSHVYFGGTIDNAGKVVGGTEASYDFPEICADSIWSDRQVIVKVPTGLVGNESTPGNYKITMEIGSWPAIDTGSLIPSTFTFKSDLPLAPSLCKIQPIMGQANSPISLWGEYFGNFDETYSKVRFQLNHDQSGKTTGDKKIVSWERDNLATGNLKPDKAVTTVHQVAVTGPVKAVKSTNPELVGNGLNFKVGICRPKTADTDDCGTGNLCCSAGTPYVGQCKDITGAKKTEQEVCFPEIKSCVYEWNFTTLGTAQCNPDQIVCGSSCCTTAQRCTDPNGNGGYGRCDNLNCSEAPTCGTTCCNSGTGRACVGGECPFSCPADKPILCDDDSCCTNCRDANGDGETECADPESCSGYGDQCANSFYCPNSPGQCSTKAAGGKIDTGVRCGKDACGELSICKGADNSDLCSYNAVLNKCQKTVGAFQTCDSSRTINDVERKPVELKCGQVDNKSVWYYDSNQTCITTPTATYTKSIDKTKCLGSACVACSVGFTCSHRGSGGEGVCAVDIPVCQAGLTCNSSGKCEKDDTAGCECCCDISQNNTTTGNNPGCCAPLTCDDTCGAGGNFGLCSGCTVIVKNSDSTTNQPASQTASNETCNCSGTSGKFCDMTGAAGKGTCKDCAQLSSAQICSGVGAGSCCVDAKNNNACRGGTGIYGIAQGNSTNYNYAYCSYFKCNKTPTSASCSGPMVASSTSPTYKTLDGPTGCTAQCVTPPQFGETCLKVATSTQNQICDVNKCSGFSCITEAGTYATNASTADCGTCCCDPRKSDSNKLNTDGSPNPNYDKCKKINDKFTCLADKGNCASNVKKCDTNNSRSIDPGETSVCSSDSDCAVGVSCILDNNLRGNRGLCCGCSADSECNVANANVNGCGSDTCCEARPSVVSTVPIDLTGNDAAHPNKVCRNTLIQATFNKLMRIDTFTNNVIVIGDYRDSQCPAGTTYLTAAYKPTILARINSWLSKIPVVNKLFTAEAQAALTRNFCKVPGTVSGYNTFNGQKTVLEFKMQKVLDPNKIYYVIIKGNSNLFDTVNNGVLSENGIGMSNAGYANGSPAYFNGLTFLNAKVWSFTTKPSTRADSGICQIDSISVNPVSYLFKSYVDNTADNLAGANYDTDKEDSDKVFRATASSADGQAIVPLAGVYNWTWDWAIDNQAVVKFKAGENASQDVNVHTLVAQNVKDAYTLLHARTTITQDSVAQTTGMIKEGLAQVYVFLCANPWPTVNSLNGTWNPWRDAVEGATGACAGGVACNESTNFELHYCRDAGGPGTADDLPAILNEAVKRGRSANLKCSDPAGSCANATAADEDCTYSAGTLGTGKCQVDILKELFFLREGLPAASVGLSVSAPPEGGTALARWNTVVAVPSVVGYKLYYGIARGNYTNSIDMTAPQIGPTQTKEITGLTNGKRYYFAFTSYNAKKVESVYSNEFELTPADTVAPVQPNILWVLPVASSTAVVGWTADRDSMATGTVSYKVCYGAVAGSCGGTVNVNRNKCLGFGCTATITNLNPGSKYYFSIVAADAAHNNSATSTVLKCSDPVGSCANATAADQNCIYRVGTSGAGKCQEKGLIMIFSQRAKDLLDISKAFYSYADKNGGKFPNSVPPGTHYQNVDGSCLGVPAGERCWKGYIQNSPKSPDTIVRPNGVPGNTALMDAISPYISKIPLDPKAPRGVGDAYIYLQGDVQFECGFDKTIYKGNWIIYQPDEAFPAADVRDQSRCEPLSSRYTCCAGLGCGDHYYCVFKMRDF